MNQRKALRKENKITIDNTKKGGSLEGFCWAGRSVTAGIQRFRNDREPTLIKFAAREAKQPKIMSAGGLQKEVTAVRTRPDDPQWCRNQKPGLNDRWHWLPVLDGKLEMRDEESHLHISAVRQQTGGHWHNASIKRHLQLQIIPELFPSNEEHLREIISCLLTARRPQVRVQISIPGKRKSKVFLLTRSMKTFHKNTDVNSCLKTQNSKKDERSCNAAAPNFASPLQMQQGTQPPGFSFLGPVYVQGLRKEQQERS